MKYIGEDKCVGGEIEILYTAGAVTKENRMSVPQKSTI